MEPLEYDQAKERQKQADRPFRKNRQADKERSKKDIAPAGPSFVAIARLQSIGGKIGQKIDTQKDEQIKNRVDNAGFEVEMGQERSRIS